MLSLHKDPEFLAFVDWREWATDKQGITSRRYEDINFRIIPVGDQYAWECSQLHPTGEPELFSPSGAAQAAAWQWYQGYKREQEARYAQHPPARSERSPTD